MKKLIVFLILLASFGLSNANASTEHTKNLSFAPITLLVGAINAGLDFKMTDTFAMGPEAVYLKWDTGPTEVTAYGVGINLEWQPYGIFKDGMYLSPTLLYAAAKAKKTTQEVTVSVTRITTILGYHWFWDSFNIALGGGFGLPLGDTEITYSDGTKENISKTRFAMEFNLGFTF